MDNQRSSNRRRMFYYLEARDADSKTAVGRVGDVSENGLMLLTDVPLELNSRHRIEIQLPEALAHDSETLLLDVVVRWIKPDHNPAISCAGCKVSKPDAQIQGLIQSLIEYYGFSDGYKEFRQLHAN